MYYIVETQENADCTASILTYTETNRNTALSKWHQILQYAAVSTVYVHSCVVLDSELRIIARESYTHIAEAGDEA